MKPNNAEVANLLAEMAVLLELEGANVFKIRAYQKASQTISNLPKSICDLTEKEMLEIPGIGKGIASNLQELAGCGTFRDLRDLRGKFPVGLREMLRLPGLGPKRARILFDEAGINSLDALRDALKKGKLRGMKGFGEKFEENIARGLQFAAEPQRLLYMDALRLARELLLLVKALPGVQAAEIAGSLRRGCETVGDIDILCSADKGRPITDAFTKLPRVEKVLAAGDTKASVNLVGGVQCDLRVVAPRSFGAALQYFTGSKEHNVAIREIALKKGLTINEYGVFKLSDKKQEKPLAGKTEAEVYKSIGLAYIPPELRESRGEIEAAAQNKLPGLIEMKDVRGDFHNHSTHTDGRHSLEEMARAARDQGWEWAALGDHSQSLTVASGLKVDQLRATFRELDEIRKKVKGIELMRSMEVDILEDGRMDYSDDVLNEIDVVIASVHSRFKQPETEMTARIVRAISNRNVDIMGHLSGRLINRRPAYAFNAETVLQAAAKAGTAMEINGQPDRQDVNDIRARRAKELGSPLALNTDAHSVKEYGHMEMAVVIARRAWLEPKDVLNCLSYPELQKWLQKRAK